MRILVAVGDAVLSRAIEGTLTKSGYDATAVEPSLVNAFGTIVGHTLHDAEKPYDEIIIDSTSLLPQILDAAPHTRTLLLATTTLLRTARFDQSDASDESTGSLSAVNAAGNNKPDKTDIRDSRGFGASSPGSAAEADRSDAAGNEGTATISGPSSSPKHAQARAPRPDAILRMPFSDTELLAYVELLSRETTGLGANSMIIRGDLTLDLTNRKAYYASTHRPMPLSRLEYDVLKTLVEASGRFVGLDELQHSIGGYFTEEGLIRNALYTLDRKLRRAGLNLTTRDDAFRVI